MSATNGQSGQPGLSEASEASQTSGSAQPAERTELDESIEPVELIETGPVVFFGTPDFAVPTLEALAESRFRPALVVSQPSRPAGRGRRLVRPPAARRARELALPCRQVRSVRRKAFAAGLAEIDPWVFVVVAFGQILPQRLLDVPKLGSINVHASLLPRYRGAAPIQAAIAAGDRVTGVTTMLMDAGLDTGPTLARREIPIGPDELAPELSTRLAGAGAELLIETLEGLASATLQPQPQDGAQASVAPRLSRADGEVSWELTARQIYDRFRAHQPWPGTRTEFRGETVTIDGCRPSVATHPEAASGTVLETSPELAVACGRGTVLVLGALQRPGRRSLAATDFVNGERVVAGDRFGLS